MPSKISYVVELWRESLSKVNEKAGQSLASPDQYDNLFPNLLDALKTEQYLAGESQKKLPAAAYPHIPVSWVWCGVVWGGGLGKFLLIFFFFIPTAKSREKRHR